MKYDIFISYSRKDTEIANQICAALDRNGISYFIDRRGIAGGMEFPTVLAEAILESSIFLLLASNNSYESRFTNSEITFAFNEKPRNTIIPYIIDGSRLPAALRFIFSGINWRTIEEHPIDTVLMEDILKLLGRPANTNKQPESISAQTIKSWVEKANHAYYDQKDYSEAFKWYKKAAEQGDAYSQCNLGYMYYKGLGVEENYEEACIWYKKAAEQGRALAQYNLGYMYCYGQGVEQNYEEACKWHKKAAEQGEASAQHNLGYMYYYGQGVEQNYEEACKWYKKAAEQGEASAQYNLGIMYQYGKGIEQNHEEACKWYKKAAEQGDEEAIEALKRLGVNI